MTPDDLVSDLDDPQTSIADDDPKLILKNRIPLTTKNATKMCTNYAKFHMKQVHAFFHPFSFPTYIRTQSYVLGIN